MFEVIKNADACVQVGQCSDAQVSMVHGSLKQAFKPLKNCWPPVVEQGWGRQSAYQFPIMPVDLTILWGFCWLAGHE